MWIRPKPQKVDKTIAFDGAFGDLDEPIARAVESLLTEGPFVSFMHCSSTKAEPLDIEVDYALGDYGPSFQGSLRDVLTYIDERLYSFDERDRVKQVAAALKELADEMIAKADARTDLED